MTIDSILEKLAGVKRTKRGWLARCPTHDDKNPSLAISQSSDGKVLIKCHAGCSTEAVVKALGLSLRDLFEDAPQKKPERRIVAAYDYTDAGGKLLYQIVRFEPKSFSARQPDGAGGWVWNLEGIQRVLYRLDNVLKAKECGVKIYLCEGEKDCNSLAALGLTATTNPHGAGKWLDEFSEPLRGAHVVILPDKDEPGRRHAEQVAKSLHEVAASVKLVELHGNAKDVSDWLAAGGTKEELLKLVEQAPAWEPAPKMSYDKLKAIFEHWLYLPDDTSLKFILCAVIANRLPGDPFWAFLVGPSGSSKTELLNSLSGLEFVKPIDTLTTSTFLSGKQRKDPEASLLLRVPYGTIFLMRDFTAILEMHREKRAEIFAQLRKIYDGHLAKCTGEGGASADLSWEGKVGLIAGVTLAIEGYRAFATTLGERFLYHYLPVLDRNAAAQQALCNRESLKEMRVELRKAVCDFISGLSIPDHVEIPKEASDWLVSVADFVSIARTGVTRDHYSSAREITYLPDPEIPTRLAQQLGALACAHAVLHSRAYVTAEDVTFVAQTALACIPTRRRLTLKLLVEAGAGMETATVAETVDLPTVTVRRDLEELAALRLAKRKKGGEGKPDLWEATETAVRGWIALARPDTRVRVKNPVPVLKEGTVSEKSASVCKGEVREEREGLCCVGDFSDKVGNLASGGAKVTVTQVSGGSEDDDIPF